jgi:UDP-2-acetamido-2,6-beta-L-arabino-hexul-4-ose reductase
VAIGRDLAADPAKLREALIGVHAVLHLAGVNRADTEERLNDNVLIARQLTDALDKAEVHPIVVYANSIQAGNATAFGETKKAAAEHLMAWGRTAGVRVADVHLPNLFGEHGRPNYNSVVATFCDALAHGGKPKLLDDRLIQLLHAQDAADSMLDLIDEAATGLFQPQGVEIKVSGLMEKLEEFHHRYLEGDIPNITSRFDRALFNTYRSFCFPDHYPIYPRVRADPRGELFEAVRGHASQCQVFLSSTRPGITRGNHFHRRKVERFLVLHGRAVIALRRLFGDHVVRFEVSGDRPAIVDMPTMWTHSIRNTGSDDLMTLFWADEIFDPEHPDTYREPVELEWQTA